MPSIVLQTQPQAPSPLRQAIREAYRADEEAIVGQLLDYAAQDKAVTERVAARARQLIQGILEAQNEQSGVEALLHEYDLSNDEGIVLMCLAEALLRVPDQETADKLIHDKITTSDWAKHLGRSRRLFVNASTWGLVLTDRLIDTADAESRFGGVMRRMVARLGEPVVRAAIMRAMRILGRTFVLGRTIDEAIKRARATEKQGYRYSYDMLGEAARTMADADDYFEAYRTAIRAIGRQARGSEIANRPGISVKLSALHPRYELAQYNRVMEELLPRLKKLCHEARAQNIGLCVDAEEAARLDLSLDLIEAVADDPELADWQGFGLAVQAYQKRAFVLLDWLIDLARRRQRPLMIRLVKGAYWDTEIKDSQVQGLADYPVFTRKVATDVSYLACARKMLAARGTIYPQFATHNAHTVAAILEMAGDAQGFEFQRLHGMGESMYRQIVGSDKLGVPCRIYAPVGSHEELLAYLVRRLLENGANSSFVNQIQDDNLSIDEMVADPVETLRRTRPVRHPKIPLPVNLYGNERRNSQGFDFSDRNALPELARDMEAATRQNWQARPLIGGQAQDGEVQPVRNPANRAQQVGDVVWATRDHVDRALEAANRVAPGWDATPAARRAECLEKAADLYEQHMAELMALCVREAGKSLADAIAEVREACDFCRYYAAQARARFDQPLPMPGPTGESNELSLHGRGTFLCISPWNFPLAIFTGQVTAALAAGNAVIAKPAEQTSLIAAHAVRLMHEAGIPQDVLNLLPGIGGEVGPALVSDARINGVAFTGSTDTAHAIHKGLAQRKGPIIPLIAETGGQNALIVDSTALPEQVVVDVLQSAFYSAGQRCSALRVLFVQEDVADKMIKMITGAMDELVVGDPGWLSTDIGPVIDDDALQMLHKHAQRMEDKGRLVARARLGAEADQGTFIAPAAFRLESIDELEREVFGPFLHVVRYRTSELDAVIEAINRTGYGLTLGIHSRIDDTVDYITSRVRVGNMYVNRNMVGAVVGTQPFGGEGLSGTGFKAGGPHYLLRFATERVLTVNTTAAGGNASLFSLDDRRTGSDTAIEGLQPAAPMVRGRRRPRRSA